MGGDVATDGVVLKEERRNVKKKIEG